MAHSNVAIVTVYAMKSLASLTRRLAHQRLFWRVTLISLLSLLAVAVVFLVANPPPPKKITMATGAEGGSYNALGKRYQSFFAQRGINLELLPTRGAQENADLLAAPGSHVQLAFMQSGLIDPEQAPDLATLGSIGYEPIWIFYRGTDHDGSLQKFTDFANRKVAIGEKGSGTYTEAMHMLSLNGLDKTTNLVTMSTAQAIDAIERGEIDAIFLIQGLQSQNIQRLLANPALHLANFIRAEAYAQQIPYLERLTIPMGGLDLKRNFPSENIQLIATTTEIVVHKDLHPAIQMLLMQAAKEINGKESPFAKRGEFPAFRGSDLPESEQAALYYQKGLPFLMNHLPFWLAEFIHRTFFFLIPILVLAFPVLKYIPEFWENRMRERINVIYTEIEKLEKQITGSYDTHEQAGYLAQLDAIEQLALKVRYSKTHAQDYYTLRSHINYVRGCLIQGKPYQQFTDEKPRP